MTQPNPELIEQRFKESLERYIKEGIPTGSFLNAVLGNNLKESIQRADHTAIDNIPHIVAYLYNDCPSLCWGSPAKVAEWINGGWKSYLH